MFNKLAKFRSSPRSKRNKENIHPRAPISAFSFDGYSASSQSSSFSQTAVPFDACDSPGSVIETLSIGQGSDIRALSSSQASSSILEEGLDIGHPVILGYEDAEEQFLEEYEDYFEHLQVDNIRKEQYPKLDLQRIVYLDYANFALFSRFQVEGHMRVLLEEGPNLGSVSLSNAPSSHLMAYVLDTQQRLLQLFNVDKTQYSVIFTTGFTAGYRLFGDVYPVKRGSPVLVLVDNHESVKHVISAFSLQGGKCIMAQVKEADLCISATDVRRHLKRQGWHSGAGGLFVYPAQSCISGVRHSLNWIPEAQQNGWQVLLDVSTYLPTGSLDLSLYSPEFVLGSLHHMLGYPSGMGFLLVRRQAYSVRQDADSVILAPPSDEGSDCHIVSEDDNINLLTFAALSFGLHHLENVGLVAIQRRTQSLAAWLFHTLKSLTHKDGAKPLLQVYGSTVTKDRGSLVSFNVTDSTGNFFPASLVQKLADRSNIAFGAGHFNNPGLCSLLNSSGEKAIEIAVFNKRPKFTCVRVSLGPMSTFADVYRLAQFLSRFRDEDYVSTEALDFIEEGL